MATEQAITLTSYQLPSNPNRDIDGVTVMLTLSYPLSKGETLDELKMAVATINNYIDNEIRMQVNSPHDCSGQAFTGGLSLLSKQITTGYVHYTYQHDIRIDC